MEEDSGVSWRAEKEMELEWQRISQLFDQLFRWPLTQFLFGVDLFAQNLQEAMGAEFDGVVSSMMHTLNRDLKNQMRLRTVDRYIDSDRAKTREEESNMKDKDLQGNDLKLVRYKVLFVKRDYEVAFPENEELISNDLSDRDFTTWKIAEFVGRLRETRVPAQWVAKGYPRDFRGNESPMIEQLPEGDKQYLRIYYEVLASYKREKFHYKERQVEVLEEIRDKLRGRSVDGGNGKPNGQPGWSRITLPKTLCVIGGLKSSESQFGDEFFNFPDFMGQRPAPGGTKLSGWIELQFSPPQGDKADFVLNFYAVGTDDMIKWGNGAQYKFYRDRAFQNPTPFNAQGKPDPTVKSGGSLNLKTGEVENMAMHAIFQNSVIAIVDKLNRIPFGFPNDYPPPTLPPGVELPFPDRPAMFSKGRFKIDSRGYLTGFEFHGETIAPVTIFPFMGLFPPFCFGPDGSFYFANPTDSLPGTSPKNAPTDETNPDGLRLAMPAFFHPHLDLVTTELHEAPASQGVPPCLPRASSGGAATALNNRLYYLGGSDEEVADRVQVCDFKTSSWTECNPLPIAVTETEAVALGDHLYVAGGRLSDGRPTDALQAFDSRKGEWRVLKSMPVAVAGAASVAVDGRFYVIGGDTSSTGKKPKPTASVQAYNPATDSWSSGAESPAATSGSAAVVVDSKIYLINGRRSDAVTDSVSVYDAFVDRWHAGKSTHRAVYGAVAAFLNDGIYLVGGRRTIGGPTDGGVQLFEFAANEWRDGPDQLLPTSESAGAVSGGVFYVCGGMIKTGADEAQGTRTNAVQEFNPGRGWSLCGKQPYITSAGVMNQASLIVGPAALSPGSRACIVGYNLADGPAAAQPGAKLPTNLNGATIAVDGVLAPIFSVSPNRVDFQIPYEIKSQNNATRRVQLEFARKGSQAARAQIEIAEAAPGIFIYTYGETREPNFLRNATALACNEDGTLNIPAQPVTPGQVVTIYATGLGEVNPKLASGEPAGDAPSNEATNKVAVTIGGQNAKIVSARLTPHHVGVCEIRARVPDKSPRANNVPVEITVSGVKSNRALISVQDKAWRPKEPVPCEYGKGFILNG